MAGYTPVFDSVFHGTLCGRWPTLPVWLTILPMADKHGHIDMTYQAMAALTGWPIELLRTAVAELMEPDPESRSEAEEGRRLVLIDPENRQWGWRVVNHEKYREKARKQQRQSEATASGKDAERKKAAREASRSVPTSTDVPGGVRRSPAESGAGRLSDSDADTDKSKREKARKRARRAPEDFEPDRHEALAELPDLDFETELKKFRTWEFKTPRSDWPATWWNWIQRCKENGQYAKKAQHRWQ